ncbi:hypothetical protein CAPTEDRAFT_224023 [Capitella teleta]|uniref:C2H2-type domain-containing protein n=1 Tax=Capitella teleta TaxID=283909 RepID=R7UG10_CAPTE|nr:hypothetical protein CAPTEDRAFT_224023 [Capitella teleta]|eukprot:ELU02738.1 hypothetical protein CAPTEDRAFT_224023 [Capitella teleta]
MAEDDDRPFVCSEPNCSMRFVNEDHLSVHKMKHEMSLSLFPGGSKASSNLLFVDQTPTPTKFLRNCEEIGLFSDLSKNPFEEAFKKAADTVHDIKTDAHVPKISPLARTEPRSVPVIVVSQDTPPGSVAPLPVASSMIGFVYVVPTGQRTPALNCPLRPISVELANMSLSSLKSCNHRFPTIHQKANPTSMFFKFWYKCQEGNWSRFRSLLPLHPPLPLPVPPQQPSPWQTQVLQP